MFSNIISNNYGTWKEKTKAPGRRDYYLQTDDR